MEPNFRDKLYNGSWAMDLKEIDILGDDIVQHWYYRSKAQAMTRLLGKAQQSTILDVGAGSAFFSLSA